VPTDNGSAYRSLMHAVACRQLGIKHIRTGAYRPQRNGKAERFIRTMLTGSAYGAIYGSSQERNLSLDGWLWHYNHQRRHSALSHTPGHQKQRARILELGGASLTRSERRDLSRGLAPMRVREVGASIRDVGRTVLIVDDHVEFRRVARVLLETDGFQVVGEAADGASAIAEAARLRPQLVLLDVQLPDLDGFAVATRLAALAVPPQVVLTSSRSAGSFRRRLAASPALGFVAKSELSGEALAAFVG